MFSVMYYCHVVWIVVSVGQKESMAQVCYIVHCLLANTTSYVFANTIWDKNKSANRILRVFTIQDFAFVIHHSVFRVFSILFFVVSGQQFLFSVFYTSEPSSAILNEYCGRDHGWGRGGKIVADHLHNTYHTPPAYNSTNAFTIPTITTIFTAHSIYITAPNIITIITERCYVWPITICIFQSRPERDSKSSWSI